ncbi:hypothetical protein GCM10022261_00680 [Brevibacterium daeguense]|uniref:PepSY domain-containing protein n=1 Tax=Brevibacterium daeguense TaxID=909936 RepID=A0ABP8EF06_9MICO|nr:hypothetical protein [Brevibacterium daeguense]
MTGKADRGEDGGWVRSFLARPVLAPAVTGLLSASTLFALVVLPADTGSSEAAGSDHAAEQAGAPAVDWEPQPIAEELNAVEPMDVTTVADAIAAAQRAGLIRIGQIDLDEDSTLVTGEDESGTLRQLSLNQGDAGILSDAHGSIDSFLEPVELDIDPAAAIAKAREVLGGEGDGDVRTVIVFQGDGTERDGGESGPLIEVVFSAGSRVTLRADDLSVVD